jgi:CTP synthase (UTP-ammonia lyase)
MRQPIRIGIIGDYDPEFLPHRATDAALGHAADGLGLTVAVEWLPTPSLDGPTADALAACDGLWCAPGSPYRSLAGALAGVRFAREADRPFIGTCGGFQHVVLEYARHVLGFRDAQHAEYDPEASRLFITGLACSLVGQTMAVHVVPGSRAFRAYGQPTADERYYCTFGLNPAYQALLHDGGLRVVGTDQDGAARIVELPDHRFFMATLFVPQLTSAPGRPHPLIGAYLAAAARFQADRRPSARGTPRGVVKRP